MVIAAICWACSHFGHRHVRKGTNAVGEGDALSLRVIACPLEHFDAIGFLAHRVEDFAVVYALESGAHQSDSQHVAGRIYVIFLYTNFQNFCWR
jgi:hypothetical protein